MPGLLSDAYSGLLAEAPALYRQVMRDNAPVGSVDAPGGLLMEPRPGAQGGGMNPLQAMGMAPVPVAADVAGLLGDIAMYQQDPSTRTPLNFGLTGLGLLPFFPALGGIIKDMPAPVWNRAAGSIPVGINPTRGEMKELIREAQKGNENALRILQHINGGDDYIWPAGGALHGDVGKHFKLDPKQYEHGLIDVEDLL